MDLSAQCRGSSDWRRAQRHNRARGTGIPDIIGPHVSTRPASRQVPQMTNPHQASRDPPHPEVVLAHEVEPGQRPTHVRYRIIALTCAMSVLLYLDRFCIAPVTDTIIKDLHLDRAQFSWAIGLFFWSYALLQVPSGWICDRYGSCCALPAFVVGVAVA